MWLVLLCSTAVCLGCSLSCQDGVDETAAIQSLLSNENCSVVELFGTCNTMPLTLTGARRSFSIQGTLRAARKWLDQPLLSVSGVNQFSLNGGGTIDGQGHLWWTGNNTTPGLDVCISWLSIITGA
jgi:hypothetical protein